MWPPSSNRPWPTCWRHPCQTNGSSPKQPYLPRTSTDAVPEACTAAMAFACDRRIAARPAVAFGYPPVVRKGCHPMTLFDTIEDLLVAPGARLLLDGVKNLFGGSEFGDTTDRDNTLYQLLYGGTSPQLGQTPPPGTIPGGPSGLLDAINQAGPEYQAAGAAVALTDHNLADQPKQIFSANDE